MIQSRVFPGLFLAASLACSALPAQAKPFDKKLSLQGISFQVTSKNDSSLNQLKITPKGLKGGDVPIEKEIEGTITDAAVADLNQDGSPEIYVLVTSAGSGSYGSLVAYAANAKKSLTEIYLAPLADDKVNSKGYMGHDKFSVEKTTLARSFPLYKDKDTNSKPTGKTRKLQYKLQAGEAGWKLVLAKAVDQ